jgi:hypothetical protein
MPTVTDEAAEALLSPVRQTAIDRERNAIAGVKSKQGTLTFTLLAVALLLIAAEQEREYERRSCFCGRPPRS